MSKVKIINFRYKIICFILVGLLFSCKARKSDLSVGEKDLLISSADIFLSDWHLNAANADYENYFGQMDSVSVFIGTDASENWSKDAFESYSKPYFDEGKAWSFSAVERHIYTNNDGSLVWFDELLDTRMGLCRGSGVIQNNDGHLKMKHYVLSVTVPNNLIQTLIELKKDHDSLSLKSIRAALKK